MEVGESHATASEGSAGLGSGRHSSYLINAIPVLPEHDIEVEVLLVVIGGDLTSDLAWMAA
eukprot:scaffold8485_cov277-Pinguiococcus_pyrenoidosus.AAC.4